MSDRTAAERQRRRRIREAMGLAVYPVEVSAQVLNELEGAGLIADRDITDKDKVAAALHRALNIWADEHFSSRVTRIAGGRR